MANDRFRQVITIAVLALAGASALAVKHPWRRTPPPLVTAQAAPQDPIYAMLDAAREGDVQSYLACYTGPMRSALEVSVRESGAGGFASYLRNSNAAIKGVAVNQPERLGARECRVRIEYVYQDRNEVQNLYLQKAGPAWKIARVDGAERVKTLVPYGTPVE